MRFFNAIICSLLFFQGFGQCPPDIHGFSTQEEVDDFVNQYPNCELAYVFVIVGDDITDLSPLSYIPAISHLEFRDLDNISSFEAFENTSILGSINIKNCNAIASLEGLHFNNSDVNPGWLSIENNNQLSSINDLESTLPLTDIVRIKNNPLLSVCNTPLVCSAINDPDVVVEISNNLSGCATVEEVAQSCTFGLPEEKLQALIQVFPNPVSEIVTIKTKTSLIFNSATVLSILGEEILEVSSNQVDLSGLHSGVYFIIVSTNEGAVTKKVIKE